MNLAALCWHLSCVGCDLIEERIDCVAAVSTEIVTVISHEANHHVSWHRCSSHINQQWHQKFVAPSPLSYECI